MKAVKKASAGLLWEGDIIHVVFQPEVEEVLKSSFELNDSVRGDVVVVQEDYSIAPIHRLFEAEGWQLRKLFWESVDGSEEMPNQLKAMSADKMTVHQLLTTLAENENTHLWIWMGQNEQDVCGYYWLIHQLTDFVGRLHVLYLNNLPFINEKGNIFYPSKLAEILPKELVKARKIVRPITLAEVELDTEEWRKMMQENTHVRTLDGGKKIVARPDNYYDKKIIQLIGKDVFKWQRLLAQIATKLNIQKPEAFWIWRIKHLVSNDVLLMSGDWGKTKDLTIRANTGELFQEL